MSGALTHIRRTSLPWRAADKTICGRPIAEFADGLIVSLDEAAAIVKKLGQQRAALQMCMTCGSRSSGWAEWDQFPAARMEREVSGGAWSPPDPIVTHELRAIAMLIERHRGEFDDIVQSFTDGDLVAMSDLRSGRRRR